MLFLPLDIGDSQGRAVTWPSTCHFQPGTLSFPTNSTMSFSSTQEGRAVGARSWREVMRAPGHGWDLCCLLLAGLHPIILSL